MMRSSNQICVGRRLQRGHPACWLVALLLAGGCEQATKSPPVAPPATPATKAVPAEPPAKEPPRAQPSADSKPAPLRETWDAIFLQGKQVGYQRTTVRQIESEGRALIRIDQEQVLRLRRDNDVAEQRVLLTSIETPQGEVLRCESQVLGGPQAQICRLKVAGDKATLEVTTAGKKTQTELAWPADTLGFWAAEKNLADKPLAAGEKRAMKCFMPLINQVAEVNLTAADYESTELPGGDLELLRVDVKTQLPGQALPSGVAWIDRTGEMVKMTMDLLQMTTYRTTQEAAEGKIEPQSIDLNARTMVKLDSPLKNPHGLKRARYRLHLENGDPAKVFAGGGSQQVASIDEHTADITVVAVRPGGEKFADDSLDAAPVPDDSAPNNLIQSDDQRVVEMAREGVGDKTDPWDKAVALTQYVRGAITLKDYRTALATAAEVAESRSGDCTEHAMLLAALARASGLPARVAMGLVYVEQEQAFMFHMWTEIHIDGTWIPLDATLGTAGIGCGHIKVSRSNLKGGSAYSSFLPVTQVLGQLRIEVVGENDE